MRRQLQVSPDEFHVIIALGPEKSRASSKMPLGKGNQIIKWPLVKCPNSEGNQTAPYESKNTKTNKQLAGDSNRRRTSFDAIFGVAQGHINPMD